MINLLLDADEKEQLNELAAAGQSVSVRKRAQLILLYDQGQPTRSVAQQVGLSRGRTRYWRARFRDHRMAIFPGIRTEPADGDGDWTEKGQDAVTDEPGAFQPRNQPDSQPQPEQTYSEDAAPRPEEEQLSEPQPKPRSEPESESELKPEAEPAAEPRPRGKRAKRSKPESPAESGYPPQRKQVGIQPEDPMPEAGRKVLSFHFAEMLAHEAGTRLGEDIEELHDMRVATRRMRAAFEVFGDAFKTKTLKKYRKGLRATGRALGRVRDLDVFMEKAQHYLDTLPEDQRSGLDPLLEAWQAEREADRQIMNAYLDSDAYQQFKAEFSQFVQTPGAGAIETPPGTPGRVCEVAPILIYSRLAAVRAFDPILLSATVPQLHALRIEFKKLRYTVEYFREVLGPEAKNVIDEIKALQDHLGDLNDADVATVILRQFLDAWDTQQATRPLSERLNPEAIVSYLAYRHAERHELIVNFEQAWARFNRPEVRRDLALAISAL